MKKEEGGKSDMEFIGAFFFLFSIFSKAGSKWIDRTSKTKIQNDKFNNASGMGHATACCDHRRRLQTTHDAYARVPIGRTRVLRGFVDIPILRSAKICS